MLQQPVTTAFPMRGMLIAIHTSAILRLPLANVTRVRMASSAKQRHSHSHERWGESNRLGFHPTPETNPGWVGPAVTGSTKRVVDRIVLEAADRPLRQHGLFQGHFELDGSVHGAHQRRGRGREARGSVSIGATDFGAWLLLGCSWVPEGRTVHLAALPVTARTLGNE